MINWCYLYQTLCQQFLRSTSSIFHNHTMKLVLTFCVSKPSRGWLIYVQSSTTCHAGLADSHTCAGKQVCYVLLRWVPDVWLVSQACYFQSLRYHIHRCRSWNSECLDTYSRSHRQNVTNPWFYCPLLFHAITEAQQRWSLHFYSFQN